MKNKLVTLIGGGGFVGRYAAQALLRAGARVRIAQRDPRQAWYLKPQGALGQTQFVAADINRPETVLRAVQGADAVVNLVGVLAGDFERAHVDGARTIADAAAKAGVETLVHVSAIGADPESASRYGRSKGNGEVAVREAFANATILRPSIVFGREDNFVNRFAGMIAVAPIVPVLRTGTKFQPVFAADVGEAIRAAVASPGSFAGHTLELGGPDVITMGKLIRWIADAIGRSPTILELPDMVGAAIARAGFLPGAPITWDQWLMLGRDNVVSGEDGLAALGIDATPMAAVAPEWLVRFRKQGRFGRRMEQAL
ncbi:complex I NDUFA9 subunit family protein [Microvirga sp. SRT01]|uniref:Complex I NDUFA9 subunit family protein n=1 Tax=Sphingomonas longa TaxID=2778730 RepID=A0ABS2D820_9SPHN|nr:MULTISPECIES: complex I NDUFA9 subunit family protein [Alphaproteobacteria]MBM6577048.1 complex I NDUFA9 subunit family protein [Sphingomonas sp. BT552]MBR7710092.1 complex I NDUFA9 subunit family protein [Microvirga sp. SRT01]